MRLYTCGNCGRSWDDSIVTSMTPAPSARCPFEAFSRGETIPDDWPVKVVTTTETETINEREQTYLDHEKERAT